MWDPNEELTRNFTEFTQEGITSGLNSIQEAEEGRQAVF